MSARGVDALTTGHWPLDYVTHNDWRHHTRNKSRDWMKYATAAFLEETLVPKYRSTLLERSAAAAVIRNDLNTLFNVNSKKRSVINPTTKKTQVVQQYVFPDRLENVENPTPPFEDLTEVLADLRSSTPKNVITARIKQTTTAILKLPSAQLTPRDNKVNPEIAEIVKKLEQVTFNILKVIIYQLHLRF